MKKTLIIIGFILVVVTGLYFVQTKKVEEKVSTPVETGIVYKKKEVRLGKSTFTLEIANTEALQERGLSYRTSLAPNTGMIFVFNTPALYYFWMKDMNFPIDIIWLDKDKKVVHIEHSLAPHTYPKSYGPDTSTQYVIEISAGETDKIGLSLGGTIGF